MTDPLAKYVRGNGTTQYYDTEAMAADLRQMIPVVAAAEKFADTKEGTMAENYALIALDEAVRCYRGGT